MLEVNSHLTAVENQEQKFMPPNLNGVYLHTSRCDQKYEIWVIN
jgi:hypothetical protein